MYVRGALIACVLVGCASEALPLDAGPLECTTDEGLTRSLLRPTCGTSNCHDAVAPRAGLDLVSEGLGERLTAAVSVHPRCRDQRLVVPGAPADSLLVLKILGAHADCGDPMPPRGSLTPEQRSCIAEWVVGLEGR